MPTKIERLIIFGDSLSDIGIKRDQGWGKVAAAIGAMRTNQMLRYSDNRNWTDFIWEWAGGSPLVASNRETAIARSAKHLKWSDDCNVGSRNSAPFYYANYAEGGAMGASDNPKLGCGYFVDQVNRYLVDLGFQDPKTGVRDARRAHVSGHALYLVWFGLNDFVTNMRKYSDAKPVAKEIVDRCLEVAAMDPHAHFLIANSPNPKQAVRFLYRTLTLAEGDLFNGVANFDRELRAQIERLGDRGAMVDIMRPMLKVSQNLARYNLTAQAQKTGIACWYDKPTPSGEQYRRIATSDEGHPTEAVYLLLAKLFANKLLEKFDVGNLRGDPNVAWWPGLNPSEL